MEEFALAFESGWDAHFAKLGQSVQERISKKILQLKTGIRGRHLKHCPPYFVEEVGGYRIVYKSGDSSGIRKSYFAGSHKDYEKWYNAR